MKTLTEVQLNAINIEDCGIDATLMLAALIEDDASLCCIYQWCATHLDPDSVTDRALDELELYSQQVYSLTEMRLTNADDALRRFSVDGEYCIFGRL